MCDRAAYNLLHKIILSEYQFLGEMMFPGMHGVTERLTRFMADKILRDACKRIGLEGPSNDLAFL
ncbi:hypothetical protein [Anabaena sp. CS-542/02]|uniref:hypothetical protein n=1 Tax=Anabaena sp. CS-542/02 TaxID=3021719 RepID=UPI00232B2B3A|nr:hypothetical protein [Anabaena sp. CS-542/02]